MNKFESLAIDTTGGTSSRQDLLTGEYTYTSRDQAPAQPQSPNTLENYERSRDQGRKAGDSAVENTPSIEELKKQEAELRANLAKLEVAYKSAMAAREKLDQAKVTALADAAGAVSRATDSAPVEAPALTEEDKRNLEVADSPSAFNKIMNKIRQHPRVNAAIALALSLPLAAIITSCTNRVERESQPTALAEPVREEPQSFQDMYNSVPTPTEVPKYESLTGNIELDMEIDCSFDQPTNTGCFSYESEQYAKHSPWSIANPRAIYAAIGAEDVNHPTDEEARTGLTHVALSDNVLAGFIASAQGLPGFESLTYEESVEKIAGMSAEDKRELQSQLVKILHGAEVTQDKKFGAFRNLYERTDKDGTRIGGGHDDDAGQAGLDIIRLTVTDDEGVQTVMEFLARCYNPCVTITVVSSDGTKTEYTVQTEELDTEEDAEEATKPAPVTPTITPTTGQTTSTGTGNNNTPTTTHHRGGGNSSHSTPAEQPVTPPVTPPAKPDHTTPDDLDLLPKNLEAEKQNASEDDDDVDRRTVNERDENGNKVTPETTLEEDTENFEAIEEQKQDDAKRAEAAEERKEEQKEAETKASVAAEERRESQAQQEEERQSGMTEEERETDKEQVEDAKEDLEKAEDMAESIQEESAPAELEAEAETESLEEAQAEADAAYPEQSAESEANAGLSAEDRTSLEF